MTRFGGNLKLVVGEVHRPAFTRVMTEVLGAERGSPMPSLDVFRLADGFRVGVYFVPSGGLSDEAWPAAPWLELRVEDPDAVGAALVGCGVEPVPYDDPDHSYFRLPGGPVFRLARWVPGAGRDDG